MTDTEEIDDDGYETGVDDEIDDDGYETGVDDGYEMREAETAERMLIEYLRSVNDHTTWKWNDYWTT